MAMALPLLAAAGGTAGAAAGTMGTMATIATVASAGMSIFSGIQGMQASKAEATQIDQQRRYEVLRAKQDEANRQAKLTYILGAQMAGGAGRGITSDSGSMIALADFSEEEAKRESGIASLDSKFQQQQMKMQSSQARRQGKASLIGGIGQAVSTVGSFAEQRYERSRT